MKKSVLIVGAVAAAIAGVLAWKRRVVPASDYGPDLARPATEPTWPRSSGNDEPGADSPVA